MKGKSLAVIASAVNVKTGDAPMNATLNVARPRQAARRATASRCARTPSSTSGRAFQVLEPTESGIVRRTFPQFLHVADDPRFTGEEMLLDTSFPAFFRLEELMFPFASSLVLHKDKQPEAKTMKVVARTSPASLHEQGDTADLRPFQNWKPKVEKMEQFNVAATVDGTLKSAFLEGDEMGVDAPEKSAQPARVFVLAASQYLANPFARAGEGQDMSRYGMQQMVGGDRELQELAQGYLSNTVLSAMILVIQGHAGLAHRRAGPHGGIGQAPGRAQPDLRRRHAEVRRERDGGPAQEAARGAARSAQAPAVLGRVDPHPGPPHPVRSLRGGPLAHAASRRARTSAWREKPRTFDMALSRDKQIGVALVVLVGLGAAVYFQQKKDAQKGVEGRSSADLPVLSGPEDLDKISIANADKGEVVLAKEDDKWMLVKPVHAHANQNNVKQLIDNLKELKTAEVVAPDPTDDIKKGYDLDPSHAIHVVAWKGAEQKVDDTFGKSGGRGEMAMTAGKPAVYAVKGYSSYLYNREAKGWRDTEIFKFDDLNVSSATIETPAGTFSFTKGDKWAGTFKGAPIDRYDDAKVGQMMQAYKGLTADDFGDGKAPAETGLDKPAGTVTINLKDNAGKYVLHVGKSATASTFYAQKEGEPTIYTVTKVMAEWATADLAKFQKPTDAGTASSAAASAKPAPKLPPGHPPVPPH